MVPEPCPCGDLPGSVAGQRVVPSVARRAAIFPDEGERGGTMTVRMTMVRCSNATHACTAGRRGVGGGSLGASERRNAPSHAIEIPTGRRSASGEAVRRTFSHRATMRCA
ncbi:hypothetical protein KM043_006114 [Ampulex compressa]|nr:hypothetical protein KM043_006114 [Ampulex compressa]